MTSQTYLSYLLSEAITHADASPENDSRPPFLPVPLFFPFSSRKNGDKGFPVVAIEAELARRGRALRFEEEEIQDLVEVRYGDKPSLALLSLENWLGGLRRCDLVATFRTDKSDGAPKIVPASVTEAWLCKESQLPKAQEDTGGQ